MIFITFYIYIHYTRFICIKVRREAGNCFAEEDTAIYNTLDIMQSSLFHRPLMSWYLYMGPQGEAEQETEWQRTDKLHHIVFHVYSHHHDGSSVRRCHVQRMSEVLQAQQEYRDYPSERQDHRSVQEGSWIRCASLIVIINCLKIIFQDKILKSYQLNGKN